SLRAILLKPCKVGPALLGEFYRLCPVLLRRITKDSDSRPRQLLRLPKPRLVKPKLRGLLLDRRHQLSQTVLATGALDGLGLAKQLPKVELLNLSHYARPPTYGSGVLPAYGVPPPPRLSIPAR